MNTLGQNIRTLRHQKGWSQDTTAKQLAISVPAFSKIETGVTDINLSRLEQIASLFQISTINLLSFGQLNSGEHSAKLETINHQLAARENEVFELQKKVIQLFEELRQMHIMVQP